TCALPISRAHRLEVEDRASRSRRNPSVGRVYPRGLAPPLGLANRIGCGSVSAAAPPLPQGVTGGFPLGGVAQLLLFRGAFIEPHPPVGPCEPRLVVPCAQHRPQGCVL